MHIIGAGGHAKVIIDVLLESGQKISGVWDENPNLSTVLGQPILGNLNDFKQTKPGPAIIAIGNAEVRKRISQELDIEFGLAIHPKSAVAASAKIGAGTMVMANVAINPAATVGQHAIINTGASIDHDCMVGDFVHVSPQVGLGGTVQVGEGTHIGIGACVIQGIKIGKWAVIGAGAVVIRDVPDFAVVVGNPARIIKYKTIGSNLT